MCSLHLFPHGKLLYYVSQVQKNQQEFYLLVVRIREDCHILYPLHPNIGGHVAIINPLGCVAKTNIP